MAVTVPLTLQRAAEYYEQATALDPHFALAWAQAVRAHSYIYYNGVPSAVHGEAARRSAHRALELAPNRAETHLAMGIYYTGVLRDYPRALAELKQADRLDPGNADILAIAGMAEQAVGHWDSAFVHHQRAHTLDPRSVIAARRFGHTLLWMRRYPEAITTLHRALALAPANLENRVLLALAHLAQGDLVKARVTIKDAPGGVDPTTRVATIAVYGLSWLLDGSEQQLLLRLSPAAFDDEQGAWGLALTEAWLLRGDQEKARIYADSARMAIERQLQREPYVASQRMRHGLTLAYLGRKAEAIREGERGLASQPVAKDGIHGPVNQAMLANIYLLVGEPEKAIDQLESLIEVPCDISTGLLRLDPTFAPLRGHPRFERLVNGT